MTKPLVHCPRCGYLWVNRVVSGILMVSHGRQALTGYKFQFNVPYEEF